MSETFAFFNDIPSTQQTAADVGSSELPAFLREIERIAGFKAAMRLVNKFGGLNLYIPQDLDKEHALAKAMGLDIAQKIAAVCGGARVAVPRAHHYRTVLRQAEIFRRSRSGESSSLLAREYGITQRAIEKIISREYRRRDRKRYEKIMGRKS